jgi:hypothetical protein
LVRIIVPVLAIPVIVSKNGRGVAFVVGIFSEVYVAIVVGITTGLTTIVVGVGDCVICGTIMKVAELVAS